MMAPTPQTSASSRLQKAPQAANKTNGLVQPPGAQVPGAMEDLDSYLDFSLETLKHMMLELDPNFQLLPAVAGGSWAEPTQSTTSKAKKEEPEALGKDWYPVPGGRLGTRLLGEDGFSYQTRGVENNVLIGASLQV